MAINKFNSAEKVAAAIRDLDDGDTKKAILMALIAVEKDGLLIDPKAIAMVQIRHATC